MSRVLVCALAASALASSFACAEPVGQRPYYAVAPSPRAPAPGYQQPQPYARYQAATPAPAPQPRYAATRGHLGGGFIEAIFGGSSEGYGNPYGAQRNAPTEAQTSRYAADPRYQRQVVAYAGSETPGTVVVDTRHFLLYLVQDGGRAIRYGVGVGRPGFTWSGEHEISNKREWPDWRPPDEMLRRAPNLPHFMAGGPENPLGARALYLGETLYRIHGSNEPWTIGTQVSSGCIRMRNEDVIDLYDRVKVGTKVVVI